MRMRSLTHWGWPSGAAIALMVLGTLLQMPALRAWAICFGMMAAVLALRVVWQGWGSEMYKAGYRHGKLDGLDEAARRGAGECPLARKDELRAVVN